MKKYSLLIIVLIILVGFVSCNLDSERGIYRSITESSEITSTRVTQALGYEDNMAYFLSDDGIYSKSNSSESIKIVSKTPSILSASFTYDKNDILFLTNTTSNETKVYAYNFTAVNWTERVENEFENTKVIFNNSFFITQDGDNTIKIKFIEDVSNVITSLSSSITTLTKVLTSEDSILVLGENASEDEIAELYSYTSGPSSIAKTSITYKNYIGFEYYTGGGYLLIDDENNVYNNNVDTTYSIEATVTDLYTQQLASFSVNEYVYFKGENYFHPVKSDGTNKELNLGFAKKLQADIVDILPEGNLNTFIVFTRNSGIYKLSGVDPTVDSSGTVVEI